MAGAVWQAVFGQKHSEPEDQQGLRQLDISWERPGSSRTAFKKLAAMQSCSVHCIMVQPSTVAVI